MLLTTPRPRTPDIASFAAKRALAAATAPLSLNERERRWLWLTDLPYLACALAALVWLPAQREFDPVTCLVLVIGLAVSANVLIPLQPPGHALAVQMVFVPMLFLAPLNLVPLLVLAGYLLSDVGSYLTGNKSLHRSVLCLGDSWWAFGPVLVLAAAGHEQFSWTHWPVYALALAAQLAVNALSGCIRFRLQVGERPQLRDVVGVTSGIDVVLTFPALSITAQAHDAPLAAALTAAATLAIARGFTAERSRRIVQREHATHDPLTGLPNRLLFGELAAAACERVRRDREPSGVLLVDLDAFKSVNDELGHDAGDQVLVLAAQRLRDGVRAADSVARLGGDEFAVLLHGRQTQGHCEQVARKLRRAFDAPFELPTGQRSVGVSVGAALIEAGCGIDEALHRADLAMYSDKRRPRAPIAPTASIAPMRGRPGEAA
jgi:diguanylate cyclase (GGDEF)-like protein